MNYPETITQLFGKCRVDIKTASEDICSFVISKNILRHDGADFYLDFGNYLHRIDRDDATALIYRLLGLQQAAAIPTRTVEEAVKRLQLHPSVAFDLEAERSKTQMKVNCLNGVFDINTGQLTEQRGKDVFDYQLNFNYHRNATIQQAKSFLSFLDSSLNRGYVDCVLRVLGYLVSSLTKARKAFLMLGRGATGKSTMMELIEYGVGQDNCSHVPFHRTSNIHARAEYAGKRLNLSRDNSNVPMKDEDGFKNLVSCEITSGRLLYQNSFDYKPRVKLVYASNVDLNFAHADDAVYDRLLVIPFYDAHPEFEMTRFMDIIEESGIALSIENAGKTDYSEVNEVCIIALLYSAAYAEHWDMGSLLQFYESGCILRWLKRLKEIDESKK